MKCFPKAVRGYLKDNKVKRAKPEDVFDIVIRAGAEAGFSGIKHLGGFNASITYGDPWEFQPALEGYTQASRYKALLTLLESTEALLAEMIEDAGTVLMHDMGRVPQTGAIVDNVLLG